MDEWVLIVTLLEVTLSVQKGLIHCLHGKESMADCYNQLRQISGNDKDITFFKQTVVQCMHKN